MEQKKTGTDVTIIESRGAFNELKEQAILAYESGLLPKAVDTKAKAVTIALMGRELGLPPIAALTGLYVVNGMVTVKSQLMLRLIYERVPGARITILTPPEKSGEECTVEMQRPQGSPQVFRYTLDEARKAGFASKPIWQQHTSTMLRWAAIRTGARIVFADAIAGCYLEDELPTKPVAVSVVEEPRLEAPKPTTTQAAIVAEFKTAEEKAADAVDDSSGFQLPPNNIRAPIPQFPPEEVSSPTVISQKQAKRLFAISRTANWSDDELRTYINMETGQTSTAGIPWTKYDSICKFIESHPVTDK